MKGASMTSKYQIKQNNLEDLKSIIKLNMRRVRCICMTGTYCKDLDPNPDCKTYVGVLIIHKLGHEYPKKFRNHK